jgi:hypothetical protein
MHESLNKEWKIIEYLPARRYDWDQNHLNGAFSCIFLRVLAIGQITVEPSQLSITGASTFQIVQYVGFKGDFRGWERLLEAGD